MARLGRAVARLARERGAVSAVEFALVLPVLICLMMGTVEMNRLAMTGKKAVAAANAIGEMLSSSQTPPTAAELQFISDSGMLIDPQVLTDAQVQGVNWWSIMTSTFTSVVFRPTVAGCTVRCRYTANVAWSAGAQRRPCGPLQSVTNGSPYSPTTLPLSLFGPGSTIVVDSQYAYRPLFGDRIAGPRTITRSAYFAPRYIDPLTLGDLSANPSIATVCPGF
jgi:Flp pilus assembly protein TadG